MRLIIRPLPPYTPIASPTPTPPSQPLLALPFALLQEALAAAKAEGLELQPGKATGYKGVYTKLTNGEVSFKSKIKRPNGQNELLGCFHTAEEAALVYARAKRDGGELELPPEPEAAEYGEYPVDDEGNPYHDYERSAADSHHISEEELFKINELLALRLAAKKRRDFDDADKLQAQLRRQYRVEVQDRLLEWRLMGPQGATAASTRVGEHDYIRADDDSSELTEEQVCIYPSHTHSSPMHPPYARPHSPSISPDPFSQRSSLTLDPFLPHMSDPTLPPYHRIHLLSSLSA